jgi:small-conductance mechanosensitive channel
VLLKLSDGSEAIIPNEVLITSTVMNLSHTDKLSYLALPVRVAYGSDLDLVRGVLLTAAAARERILSEPAPQVFVKTLGDVGIELELGFWISDLHSGVAGLRSELYLTILRMFAEKGIDIPYPRRDVQLLAATGIFDGSQSSSDR